MLQKICENAKIAARDMAKLGSDKKNECLNAIAGALLEHSDALIQVNETDVQAAREKGVKESLIDRLKLTKARIDGMAEGLVQLVALEDPVGEVVSAKVRPNGLEIGQKRVPLGVVGIIY